jgi:hypothetical protein
MARAMLDDLLRVFRQRAFRAGHAGHAGGLHGVLGADLVAHQADGFRARADEDEAGFLDALGEVGVLGQEAVAGMDGLGVGDLGRRDDGRECSGSWPMGAGPMHTDSSASLTYLASVSASECTTTVLMPSSRQARWMRRAISPRLAIRIFSNILDTPAVEVRLTAVGPRKGGCAA